MVVYESLNTAIEGIVADAGHAVGDGNRSKATATFKGIVADAGHTFRDSDGGQATATRKCRFSNAVHSVRNYKVGYLLIIQIQMVRRIKGVITKSKIAPCF